MKREKLIKYLNDFKLTDEEIEYFELFDELNVEKIGSLVKGYLRCKGKYLEPMYDYLTNNPDNNYVTCLDELIYTGDKSEFLNKSWYVEFSSIVT